MALSGLLKRRVVLSAVIILRYPTAGATGRLTTVKKTMQETADLHHQRIPHESLPPLYGR